MSDNKNQQFSDACTYGNIELVKQLIGEVDINFSSYYKDSTKDIRPALICAVQHKHPEIVELLLNNGANVEVTDRYGEATIAYACRSYNVQIIILLLKHDVDITRKGKFAKKNTLDDYPNFWVLSEIQEAIFMYQPYRIKLINDMYGILPEIQEKFPHDYYGAVVVNIYSV